MAVSFADGFADALLDAGVPPLEVDAPAVFHTGQRLRINLEAGTIANLSSGDRQPVRNLTEALLARLRASAGTVTSAVSGVCEPRDLARLVARTVAGQPDDVELEAVAPAFELLARRAR